MTFEILKGSDIELIELRKAVTELQKRVNEFLWGTWVFDWFGPNGFHCICEIKVDELGQIREPFPIEQLPFFRIDIPDGIQRGGSFIEFRDKLWACCPMLRIHRTERC